MRIINVDFDATGQLLIIYSAFVKYLRKNEAVHQLFVDFQKAYDSVGREVPYNILIESDTPMKLVRLIKMCLNETYSRCLGRQIFVSHVSYWAWFETRRCFTVNAFQLCFSVRY